MGIALTIVFSPLILWCGALWLLWSSTFHCLLYVLSFLSVRTVPYEPRSVQWAIKKCHDFLRWFVEESDLYEEAKLMFPFGVLFALILIRIIFLQVIAGL